MDKTDVKAIDSILNGKSEAQIRTLLVELCQSISDAYEYVLHWGKTTGNEANELLALEYWANAEAIIDEFNTYGGGPEDKENECYDEIESLCQLIPELTWETRQEIMDGMLEQYHVGNSGFDDLLTDTCFKMCKERVEWIYLAEKLLEYDGRWDKKLAMDIYKTIGDEKSFLDLRQKNLQYGTDYYELVDFFDKQGNVEKALSYAHKGLTKGEGRVDCLIKYLFDHYEAKKDTDALEKIIQTCVHLKKELSLVYDRIFVYYKTNGDYESAKKYILKTFEYAGNRGLDKLYNKIKEYLNDSDWQAVCNKLFKELKKRDLTGYLNTCLNEGLKREVYNIITEKKPVLGAYSVFGVDYDFFADKLKHDFPEEIREYFSKLAVGLVESGAGSNRKSYKQAVDYLYRVKEIYVQILNEKPRWEKFLAELKERYKKRKAFLEEVHVLE